MEKRLAASQHETRLAELDARWEIQVAIHRALESAKTQMIHKNREHLKPLTPHEKELVAKYPPSMHRVVLLYLRAHPPEKQKKSGQNSKDRGQSSGTRSKPGTASAFTPKSTRSHELRMLRVREKFLTPKPNWGLKPGTRLPSASARASTAPARSLESPNSRTGKQAILPSIPNQRPKTSHRPTTRHEPSVVTRNDDDDGM